MNVYRNRSAVFLLLLSGLGSSSVWAHKGVKHKSDEPSPVATHRPTAIENIRSSYVSQIDVLLRRACGDCHSDDTRYPWYAKLPFVDSMIANDIAEAKEHLNISSGFPFQGHGNPVDDLKAIRDVIKDNSMPPVEYRLMHRSEVLTAQEKAAILGWIEKGLVDLEAKNQ